MMKSALLVALLSPLAMTHAALDACSDCIRSCASRILASDINGLQTMCSSNNTCPITQAHCDFISTHPSFVTGYFVGSSLPLGDASRTCVLTGRCSSVNRTAVLTALLQQTEIDHQAYDLIHTSALLDLWPSPSNCNENSLFDESSPVNTDNQISSISSIAQDLGNMGAINQTYNPTQQQCVECTKRNIVSSISNSLTYITNVCASHQNDGDFWTSRCNYVNNATNLQAIEGYLTGHFNPTTFAVGSCLGDGECSSVNDLQDWHPVQPFAVRLGFNGF